MDILANTPRTVVATPAPGLEQMPQDVLQHIVHYLPVKGARNVFRLLSKGYLVSTDYLRIAGLVQARIRCWDASEKQLQALQRFTRLIDDCMDQRLPAGTTISLFMELIDLLPLLPTADLPAATRSVIASTRLLGEKAGHAAREKCMERCIATYQHRSGMDAQLPGFVPLDDEEAVLAARHFSYDLDRTFAEPEELLSHMENLGLAMEWAGRAADAAERDCLLIRMCRHGVTTFIMLNQMNDEVRALHCLPRAQALRTKLAQTSMRLLPALPVTGKAALISLALEVSANDRASYRLAVQAARRLIRQTPDSALLANWKAISKALFRGGVVQALTQRACAWPDPQCRAAMLKQLASAAYDKGALDEMDRLCDMVNELVPPDKVTLYEGMSRHADAVGQARIEFIARELIPPLIAMPPGKDKLALVFAASDFIFAYYAPDPGLMGEAQLGLQLRVCLASYTKLITATFGISAAGDEQMRGWLKSLAEALLQGAYMFRADHGIGARATMKSGLIALLGPLAERFNPIPASITTLNKTSNTSRVIAASSHLEQLPRELFQKIVHYLPVKTARNAFRLVNRHYLADTYYLRMAGLLQGRIRNKVGTESQQQAETRLASLMNDCMSNDFPVALRRSLLMELIGTLPQLAAVMHARAMRVVLARCDTIGERCGQAIMRECMATCIHAYQQRLDQTPHLEMFTPENDEEARIAVAYFTDIDPAAVSLSQVIRHLHQLLHAICCADLMKDVEEGERALIFLYEHGIDTFAVLDGLPFHLKQGKAWADLVELKSLFARPALLMLPLRSPPVQAVLVSLILSLSTQGSAMYRQAENDGLALLEETSDAMLPSRLAWLANNLFHGDLVDAVTKRVQSWPEAGARLAMLRQLAVVAWEKGAMGRMEKLCAEICRLDPPDLSALETLMQANTHKDKVTRLDISTRDVLPYLLHVPPGPTRDAAVRSAAFFSIGITSLDTGLKERLRSAALYTYALSALMKLKPDGQDSKEAQPDRRPDAAAPAATGMFSQSAMQAMLQAAEQVLKQLMPKPGD